MPRVPMRQILDEAAKGSYGVGAFNVNNMEQILAIMEAAAATKSPVILQASRGALKYSKLVYLKHLMEAAEEDNPNIPIAVHLDHGDSAETCKQAIELGFTSVMIDGSLQADGKTPRSFEDNVAITKEVVELAHPLGITVEGELGCLGGIEDGHGAGLTDKETQKYLTDPAQAEEFVRLTGVDALAVAIGTSHGAFKSSNRDDAGNVIPPTLAMERVHEINARMPQCHMVMHGSSSLPKELIDLANSFHVVLLPSDGTHNITLMGRTYNMHNMFDIVRFAMAVIEEKRLPDMQGIPLEAIAEGIAHGVRKVNVDTDSRLAMTGTLGNFLGGNPGKFDPRDYNKPAMSFLAGLIASRMKVFGQAGHASDYAPMTCADMATVYKAK